MNDDMMIEDFAELSTAEEFFEFFSIPYDPAVLKVHKVKILMAFHEMAEPVLHSFDPEREAESMSELKELLAESYTAFAEGRDIAVFDEKNIKCKGCGSHSAEGGGCGGGMHG